MVPARLSGRSARLLSGRQPLHAARDRRRRRCAGRAAKHAARRRVRRRPAGRDRATDYWVVASAFELSIAGNDWATRDARAQPDADAGEHAAVDAGSTANNLALLRDAAPPSIDGRTSRACAEPRRRDELAGLAPPDGGAVRPAYLAMLGAATFWFGTDLARVGLVGVSVPEQPARAGVFAERHGGRPGRLRRPDAVPRPPTIAAFIDQLRADHQHPKAVLIDLYFESICAAGDPRSAVRMQRRRR